LEDELTQMMRRIENIERRVERIDSRVRY